ncbi:MAG: hypothetical protein KF784_09785 [Fimbriimonadaceae bacterium]|nr:hypothetical protein [Fimbriimonadaceae bacterium]
MKRVLFSIAVCGMFAASAFSQTTKSPQGPPADAKPAQAKPEDVKSVDSIIKALYDVISGPAGQKRDWDRFRSLFSPDASMAAYGKRPNGEVVRRAFSPEEYITMSGAMLEERGFFETEVARRTEQFRDMAQVWSTYESRSKKEDEKPFQRGINSIQLYNDGKRWWIVTVFWEPEGPQDLIPEKYLKGGGE